MLAQPAYRRTAVVKWAFSARRLGRVPLQEAPGFGPAVILSPAYHVRQASRSQARDPARGPSWAPLDLVALCKVPAGGRIPTNDQPWRVPLRQSRSECQV